MDKQSEHIRLNRLARTHLAELICPGAHTVRASPPGVGVERNDKRGLDARSDLEVEEMLFPLPGSLYLERRIVSKYQRSQWLV